MNPKKISSKDNRGTESSRPKEKNRKTEDRNVQKQRSKKLGDVKPKTDVTASAESTPASKSKTPSQAKSQRLSKLSNFKNIRLNPKLKIGLKIGAGLLLDIGLSILESWIDNRHIQKLFNKIAPNISLEANRAFQQAENEILKFRTGNELEKGYQLYFKINLKFSRTCSDGGCGFSGSMNNIQLVSIEVVRNQSKNRIPDPKESNFGDLSKVNGFIFESIFENGKYITLGVNHAADGNFTLIYSLIGKKREGYLREQDAIYIRQFDEYVRAFPESFSAVTWQRLSMFINFKKLLTGAGLYSPWDLWIEDKIPFETIIEEVQWEDGFLIRDTFIKDFYDFLPKWAKTDTKYYLKKYEKYFALLKNRDRVCNVSCHSTNDRGLNYRGILTDFGRDMLNEMEVPKFIQKSN